MTRRPPEGSSRAATILWGAIAAVMGCGPVIEPPDPEPLYFEVGDLPSAIVPCGGISIESEALTVASSGRVWIAIAADEFPQADDCVEEADGPWSRGSDERLEDSAPQRGVFVSWTDDEGRSFRALQRLSSGEEGGGSFVVKDIVSDGDLVVIAVGVSKDGSGWLRLVLSEDNGTTWLDPIDIARPTDGEQASSTFGALRVGPDVEIEAVGRFSSLESTFLYTASRSHDFVATELPSELLYAGTTPAGAGVLLLNQPDLGDEVVGLEFAHTSDPLDIRSIPVEQSDDWQLAPQAMAIAGGEGFLVLSRIVQPEAPGSCAAIEVDDMEDPGSFTLIERPASWPFCAYSSSLPSGYDGGHFWTTMGWPRVGDVNSFQLYWGWQDPEGPWLAEVPFWHGLEDNVLANNFAADLNEAGEVAYFFGGSQFYRLDVPPEGVPSPE